MMFISSTIYHAMKNNTAHKYILRIIDHSMIYVAISGTYTPVLLTVVGGWIGWFVFILLWGTTIWGILYKSISVNVNPKLSLIVYLVMGWVGIIFLPIIIMYILVIYLIHCTRRLILHYWCLVLCPKPSILSYDLAYFYRNRFNVSFNSNTLFYLENLK